MVKVFLDDLPHIYDSPTKGIDWCRSIGKYVDFIYEENGENISGKLHIVDYNKENRKLKIEYNNNISEIRNSRLQDGNIKKIIGATLKTTQGRFADFKIQIGTNIKDHKRNFTILDRKRINTQKYQYRKMYKYHCNICGYKDGWLEECDILHHKNGCSCCSNNTVVEGINDITTTDPWMIPYFQGGCEEAKQYTSGSTVKINPICPICGQIKRNKISISQIHQRKSIGCICNDGISYPEKFFIEFLNQLNIKYLYQISKNDFKWINKYYYDFYLIEYNCIIETNGLQHYKDINWSSRADTHKNDEIKRNLALNNNIAYYIEIDCRKSELDFIKNSILESKLSQFLDLSNIDWIRCSEYACRTIIKDICDFWNINNHDTQLTAKHFKLSPTTICMYLKRGNIIGWCLYPYYSYRKVLVFKDTKYIGTYDSTKHLENVSEKEFGTLLGQTQIINNCNSNKNGYHHTYKGYYFMFEPYYIKLNEKIS